MSEPGSPHQSLHHRLVAGLVGLMLGLSSLLCGVGVVTLLPGFGVSDDSNGGGVTILIVLGLLTPMLLLLVAATTSLFVFAFTGRRGPMIHQGCLKVLTVVCGTGVSLMFVASLLSRNWSGSLGALGLGVQMLGIFLPGLAFSRHSKHHEV